MNTKMKAGTGCQAELGSILGDCGLDAGPRVLV